MLSDDAKKKLQEAARAFKDGRTEAFDLIFELSADAVFRICMNIIGQFQTAEDTMQEVFMSVFKALPGFREEASFTTWLYKIAVNKSLTVLKKKKETILAGDEFPDIPIEADPEDELRQQELELLRACIQELPPDFKTVVVMRDVEGLTYEEMAEVEAVPVGTIRSRLNRARGILKDVFFAKRNRA